MKRWTYTQADGDKYTRIHAQNDRPWEVVSSQSIAKKIFLPLRSPVAPNSLVPRANPPPDPATRRSSPRQASRSQELDVVAPPSYTNAIRNPKGPRFPSQPGSRRREGEPRSPFPCRGSARIRAPTEPGQPFSPHCTGPGYYSFPWNRQLVGRAVPGAGEAVPDGPQLSPPAVGTATGSCRLPGWGQPSARKRNPVAAESLQARSGSALPPLSSALSLPPLGGLARTRHSMQRATAGQDKGVLAGSYRERRYCSIAKRLSPAARSLPSFPPARLLPAPACFAAARSCRRCGLQAQTPAGEGRKRVIIPGPLHRPSPGTARPAPPPQSPRRGKPGRRPPGPARVRRGSRPPGSALRLGSGGKGAPPRLVRCAEGSGLVLPEYEGEAPPLTAARDEVASCSLCPSTAAVTGETRGSSGGRRRAVGGGPAACFAGRGGPGRGSAAPGRGLQRPDGEVRGARRPGS